MPENFNSDYKDTNVAKKFVRKYNMLSIFFALGIFFILISFIPMLLIKAESFEIQYLPTIIIAGIGFLMAIISKLRLNSLRDESRLKYTVAAYDYLEKKGKDASKIFRRDAIIGILLIILTIVLYFLLTNKNTFIPENYIKYFVSFLILVFAIALFIIINSKGRRDAYKFIRENI